MSEPTTLGSWLRRERERRGVTLAKISEETKVAVPLLQGLEADDLSRWPGGIFRRAFVRSYAAAVGLDAELVVRRVEEEHPSEPPEPTAGAASSQKTADPSDVRRVPQGEPSPADTQAPIVRIAPAGTAARVQAMALDLLVAGAIGFGFAAAGSRLLWPVIAIAAYHALGLLLTGTTPMMALLAQSQPAEIPQPSVAAPASDVAPARRPEAELRHARRARARRTARTEQPTGSRH